MINGPAQIVNTEVIEFQLTKKMSEKSHIYAWVTITVIQWKTKPKLKDCRKSVMKRV